MNMTIFIAFLSKTAHTESHDNFSISMGEMFGNFILFGGKIFNFKQ